LVFAAKKEDGVMQQAKPGGMLNFRFSLLFPGSLVRIF